MSASDSFPPLDQVLKGLDLPASEETRSFDLTLGLPGSLGPQSPQSPPSADTRAAVPAGAREPLPELSVLLDASRPPTGEDLEIQQLIGRGGMGEVWLARQRSLGRDVAIKIPTPVSDEHVERALVEEARVTGALEHPAIVPVHALGRTASGQTVLVMKRIEGVVWRELLRSPNHPHWANLGPDEPLVVHIQILIQLCNALELAHRRGFVHRDVKPANVMVGSSARSTCSIGAWRSR